MTVKQEGVRGALAFCSSTLLRDRAHCLLSGANTKINFVPKQSAAFWETVIKRYEILEVSIYWLQAQNHSLPNFKMDGHIKVLLLSSGYLQTQHINKIDHSIFFVNKKVPFLSLYMPIYSQTPLKPLKWTSAANWHYVINSGAIQVIMRTITAWLQYTSIKNISYFPIW